MPTFTKFYCYSQDVGRKVHNLHTDTLKLMLTNTAPSLSNAVKTDITEISAGNGYSAGGATIAGTSYSQSSGVAVLHGTTVVITASGGSIGPFRYAVVYNDTAASDQLIGYVDHGAAITLSAGETYTFTIDGTAGLFSDG